MMQIKMNINIKQFKFPPSKCPGGSKIHFEYVCKKGVSKIDLCEEIPFRVTFSTVFLFQYIFSLDPQRENVLKPNCYFT